MTSTIIRRAWQAGFAVPASTFPTCRQGHGVLMLDDGWAVPAERSLRVQPGFQAVAVTPDGTCYTLGRADVCGCFLPLGLR